ncbi:hypothetical protein [Deinococcus koreensis]|nr:hypothetical protein [Deinococcus koreensis]
MTSTGLGRHNSKPLLEWDEVEIQDETPDETQKSPPPLDASAGQAGPLTEKQAGQPEKAKPASPWSAVRQLFKR